MSTLITDAPTMSVRADREEVIQLEDLVVRFGSFTAVDRLSLSIPRGEIFGFLGPNGAGKSTTIRVLIGCQRPSAGTVTVLGHRVPAELGWVKPEFGYVPDTENHIEEFTGRENLELFARLYNVSLDRVDQCLQLLELIDAAHVAVRNYSKGMRRKLLLAREILHQPRVLYLDEPTANLDSHSTSVVRRLLQQLAARGVTVFLTTHNMKEVEEICDRVAIICRGTLVDLDTPSDFVRRHSEQRVDVAYSRPTGAVRETLNIDDFPQRQRLAELVINEPQLRMHSHEFCFEDVFLKLTGQAYQ